MLIKPDTKEILAESLQELLKNRSFSDITVQDITNKSGTSRTTFYRHFSDKYELMNWIFKNKIDQYINNNPEIRFWRKLFFDILYYLKEKQAYFSIVAMNTGQNSFSEFIYLHALDYCTKQLKKEMGIDELPNEIFLSAKQYCAGNTYIMLDWLRRGAKEPPDCIAALLCDSMPQSLSIYFK